MTFSRSKATTPTSSLVLLCLALASSVFGQATVRTQLLAQSPTFVSVNAWIKNSGPDTLKNLHYVWFMDWTDHGSAVVPELDWTSIKGVTMSATLRPDYIAEARYNLGSLVLAPGAEVQLNTRLRLKDWSPFQASNDWSYAGLNQNGTMSENPYVAVYAGRDRVWGYPEKRLSSIGVGPKIQIRTVKTQQSSNTLGLDVHFVNTGSVPVTRVVTRWMGSLAGRTSPIVAATDWSDADSVYLRQTWGAPGSTEIGIDLGPTIIGVGRERVVKLRFVSSDWSAVDWSQDWSYAGISPTGWNDRVEVEVRGYPSTGTVPDEVDTDCDGWSDALEAILGTDPLSAASIPEGIPMRDGLIQDVSVPHVVTYDASSLPGYASRNDLSLTIPAGAIQGVAPRITTSAVNAYPQPIFDGALQVGSTLEVLGSIQPGQSLEMPIPLPDGLVATLPEHIQVVHFVNGQWQQEHVAKIENGAAYVQLTSFSPIAVGLVQQRNWLAAGDGFALSIDKQGFPWATGRSDVCQLGGRAAPNPTPDLNLRPVYWPRLTRIVAVAAGNKHSLGLDEAGNVWAWGDNTFGQAGRPTLSPVCEPTLVVDASLDPNKRVVQISAGDFSSYAVTVSGRVLAWGSNSKAQLGRGIAASSLPFDSVPQFVVALDSVRQVAAGTAHVLALRANTSLVGWGSNQGAAIYRSSLGSGLNEPGNPIAIPLDLARLGADTITVGGCPGPGGTACWSQKLINLWHNGPSMIGAGGQTSYAKLYNRRSSGKAAANLMWGNNDRHQITYPGQDSILIPVSVSGSGQNEIALGRSHILEWRYDGYAYDPVAGAVKFFYPVRARGSNFSGQSDPLALLERYSIKSWKDVYDNSQPPKRLRSDAVAAGVDISLSWDGSTDTIYAWGGPWGWKVNSLSRGDRSFLTFLDPEDGDTLPTGLQTIHVHYQIWKDGAASTRSQFVSTSECPETGPCELLVQDQGVSAVLRVVFKTGLKGKATPIAGTIDLGRGEKGRFRVALPYAARVGIDVWPLSAPDSVANYIYWGLLSSGEHELDANWIDGGHPTPGSYGMTLYYRYDGEVVKTDTIRFTEMDSATNVFPKKLYSGLTLGGPDSLLVNLEGKGVLRGRLKSHASDPRGDWMDGAWDLKDSGQQRVGVWNVSQISKQPILDTTTSYVMDWEFRKVINGLRVEDNSCQDWAGMNSFRIDPFLSELPSITINHKADCALGWELKNKPSSGTTVYNPIGVIPSSNLGEVEHSIPLGLPGPHGIGMAGKWSIGVGNKVAYPRSGTLEYRSLEVVK